MHTYQYELKYKGLDIFSTYFDGWFKIVISLLLTGDFILGTKCYIMVIGNYGNNLYWCKVLLISSSRSYVG